MGICLIEGGAAAAGGGNGSFEILNQMGRIDGETYSNEEGLIIFSDIRNNNNSTNANRWKTVAENIDIKNYDFIGFKTVYYPISNSHVYSTEDVFFNDTDTNIRLHQRASIYKNTAAEGAETKVGDSYTITNAIFFPVSNFSNLGTVNIKLKGNPGYQGDNRIGFSKIIVYGIKGEIKE